MGIVPDATHSCRSQYCKCFFDVVHCECGVRFSGWAEILFHADMQLARAHLKPATTT